VRNRLHSVLGGLQQDDLAVGLGPGVEFQCLRDVVFPVLDQEINLVPLALHQRLFLPAILTFLGRFFFHFFFLEFSLSSVQRRSFDFLFLFLSFFRVWWFRRNDDS